MTDWASAFGNADMGVEQALADLEREKQKLREVSKIWEESTTIVRAKDNSFSMTFDGRGELTDVSFQGSKYRSLPPAQLAHHIVEAVRQGRNEAMAKVEKVMGTGATGLDFAGVAGGKVDPMEMMNSLLGPMLEGLDGLGMSVPGPSDKGKDKKSE
ncbi:YbaB/EbfC family nucleoid-associated protein [Amycolatopsis coloradensis]|uniref:YbaB/EbfC family nucleoid-associated protein n=1 Tax=Amycolatopsis coloradensis TaxID=76021 RepID=A0ACD5BE60_9PSEU